MARESIRDTEYNISEIIKSERQKGQSITEVMTELEGLETSSRRVIYTPWKSQMEGDRKNSKGVYLKNNTQNVLQFHERHGSSTLE